VYSRNTLHTSTYIHALPDINQSICIVNYKSINLNESGLDAWAIHMARHFIERVRHEARRRPLAAIRHTQRFNIFIEHTKKCDSSKGSGVSHRGSTTSRAGLRQKQQTPSERHSVLQQHISLNIMPNTWLARSGGSETKQGKVPGLLGAISKKCQGGDSRGGTAPTQPERGRESWAFPGRARKRKGHPALWRRKGAASCAQVPGKQRGGGASMEEEEEGMLGRGWSRERRPMELQKWSARPGSRTARGRIFLRTEATEQVIGR
jgi:hypothetical protein